MCSMCRQCQLVWRCTTVWGMWAIWLHRSCMDMSTIEYSRLGQESSIWLCCNCGLRNMASSLFRSWHLDSQTTHDSSAFSLGSISSPGEPLHMSSPEKVPRPKSVKGKPSLNIVNVNCQSISAKRLPFEIMINRVQAGCCNWYTVMVAQQDWKRDRLPSRRLPDIQERPGKSQHQGRRLHPRQEWCDDHQRRGAGNSLWDPMVQSGSPRK